ncbi:MAG: hypothetical protein DMG05_20985 [Acidobacteria bacterium]|nr:MAG: hypothetical protein DMG05_20985 [Acidobacteriota bacterium]
MITRFIWLTQDTIPPYNSIVTTYQQIMFITKAQEANRGDAETQRLLQEDGKLQNPSITMKLR